MSKNFLVVFNAVCVVPTVQKDKFKEIEVGSIIISIGHQIFDLKKMSYYGYGKYPGVYTSL
jgi:heterodisulfide reductase subunit A